MKQKMMDRLKNYAGNERPRLARRVTVRLVSEDEHGNVKYGASTTGIFPVHPNRKPRVEKED